MADTSTAPETQFVAFDTDPRWVVTIPDGFPGFEKCRRYVFVASESIKPFSCLQGLEDSKPSFLVIDPRLVLPSYPTTLSAEDRHRLQAADHDTLLWLGLITVKTDAVLVNLRAPVVINPNRMIGLQVIDGESTQPTEHLLTLD